MIWRDKNPAKLSNLNKPYPSPIWKVMRNCWALTGMSLLKKLSITAWKSLVFKSLEVENECLEITSSPLVVKWLRIYLSVQGTRVGSLVWEDSTRCGATKQAQAPQLLKSTGCRAAHRDDWVHALQLMKPVGPKACAPHREAIAVRSPHTTRVTPTCHN